MTTRPRVPEPLRALARKARKSQWRITPLGCGHLRWEAPHGTVVTTSSTPSDWRGTRNEIARLRRAGLREEGP